jgi:hypothetical protein
MATISSVERERKESSVHQKKKLPVKIVEEFSSSSESSNNNNQNGIVMKFRRISMNDEGRIQGYEASLTCFTFSLSISFSCLTLSL